MRKEKPSMFSFVFRLGYIYSIFCILCDQNLGLNCVAYNTVMIKIDFIQYKEITQSTRLDCLETAYDAKPEVLQPFWVLA